MIKKVMHMAQGLIIKEIRNCKCTGRDETEAENGRGCNKIPIQKFVENGI